MGQEIFAVRDMVEGSNCLNRRYSSFNHGKSLSLNEIRLSNRFQIAGTYVVRVKLVNEIFHLNCAAFQTEPTTIKFHE